MEHDGPFWQFKELEKALASIRPILSTSEEIAKMLASPVQDLEYLSSRYLLPTSYLTQYDSVANIAKQLVTDTSFPAMYEIDRTSASALFSVHEEMIRVLEEMKAPSYADISMAHSRIAESLLPPETMLQSGLIDSDFAKSMISPQLAFSEFAEKRLGTILGQSEAYATNTMSAILAGTSLLKPMGDGLEYAALFAKITTVGELDLDVNAYRYYDTFINTHIDLEEELDFDDLIDKLSIESISQLGANIVELVYNINTEAEREGRQLVFKPTNKALRACCIISTKSALSEDSFNEIVDQLFFLLYEGSGSAKRLLEKTDKEVDKDEFEPLWQMKQLRLAARHDVSHGKPAEIKKKSMVIGNSFNSLIGKVMPKQDTDWLNAQHEMYSRLIGVLEHYWYL